MKKKEEEEETIHNVYVVYTSTDRETSDPDPNDKWDRADTTASYEIIGLARERPSTYRLRSDQLVVPFEIEDDKQYYLLYYVYSAGDSFGHDENGGIEFVGLYETEEIPLKNLDRIYENKPAGKRTDHFEDAYSILFLNSKGQEYREHAAWRGYFNSFSYAKIEMVGISKADRYTLTELKTGFR